ncbi:MAG: SOS response-associated peptidase, partial [Olivibacter sp.]|nr:SOS response-associated peptidase [Olivibacter sp. UJ_SKK_5.1]
MCYYVTIHSNLGKEIRVYDLDERVTNPIALQYEFVTSFTFPNYPVIARIGNQNVLMEMGWSVDPFYEKDEKKRAIRRRSMANARSERILEDKRSYWYRIRRNRCLIPVSGTFEHREIKGMKRKVPYYIWMKDRDMQFIPGLYQLEERVSPDGEVIQYGSFTMITRAANNVMSGIHNSGDNKHRMPLFLTPEIERFWLEGVENDNDIASVFQFEMPDEEISYHTIYPIVGTKARPDEKHVWEKWDYDDV